MPAYDGTELATTPMALTIYEGGGGSELPHYVPPEGMPLKIFHSKYSRQLVDGSMQSFADRMQEVVEGNFSLDPRWPHAVQSATWSNPDSLYQEYLRNLELAKAGVFLTSGRHLQHGDSAQADKLMELFTNCATAPFSFMVFRLLLRGSGVGRDYSSVCCRVNWDNMPNIRLVLDQGHPDFAEDKFTGFMEPLHVAQHKYDQESEHTRWFKVDDSREGWSKCIEVLETAAWQEKHGHKLFIFDFSDVRCAGTPIKGLQNRPAAGPIGLMQAMAQIFTIKGAGMKPWRQAMEIDDVLAGCVQLGGARRSSRIAVKRWQDRDVIDFIDLKRGGFLRTANNSVLVDAEFWQQAASPRPSHARRVFEAITSASYFDSTGEPGFINIDKLHDDRTGMTELTRENYINRKIYHDLHPRTIDMIDNVLGFLKKLDYPYIVNPCGEVVLSVYGGYCVIGDVCLALANNLRDVLDAGRLLAKFLVRVNRMKCEYDFEVKRTNRIGVGLTGIHEFAYQLFQLTFAELVAYFPVAFEDLDINSVADSKQREILRRSERFWLFLEQLQYTVNHAADSISDELKMIRPHTTTTMKPSGTVGKVAYCTEGAHLPPHKHYLRWVQYHISDLRWKDLQAKGYPVMDIQRTYHEHIVVGFPTRPRIIDIMGDKVTIASEATPQMHYQWLMLLDKFWLGDRGNQISYTLNYNQADIDYLDYMKMILTYQPRVKVCTVMPQDDWRKSKAHYGYVPEEPITAEQYAEYMARISARVKYEEYTESELECANGACPIELDINQVG